MPNRLVKAIAWSLLGLVVGVVAGAAVLTILNRSTVGANEAGLYTILGLSSLSFATVGSLIARRHPRNPIGWLFCVMGIGFVGAWFSAEYAVRAFAPPGHPLPAASLIGFGNDWLWTMATGPIGLVFLLFPNGRPPSPRWRIVGWALGVLLPLSVLAAMLNPHVTTGNADRFADLGFRISNPLGVTALKGLINVVLGISALVIVLGSIASVVALVLRLRRATGEERQQLRWVAYTGSAGVLTLLFLPVVIAFQNIQVLGSLFWYSITVILALGIPLASGVAIMKYRLYDLDVVVKKTVVLAALLVFSTLVYLAVVVGIGAAIGSKGNAALTLAAAAIVAIAFQPLRTRARRVADRIVYGKRATPYEVLSEFSDRMAATYSADDVLPRMARLLAQGTGAKRAGVWLRVGSEVQLAASWPDGDGAGEGGVHLDDLDALPGSDRTFPVRHQDEILGALAVAMPASEPLTPSQEKLIRDLASQAGLVLRNVRLIAELRASRQRLVAAQDQERRRLERNLHDGAQQHLVALAIKQRLVESMIERDPEAARKALRDLQADTADALGTLRELARGIYPPLLADRGLAEALRAQARKAPLPVEVEADGVGRYSQDAEAAVYFCCLEALQNVAKYAGATSVVVRLSGGGGELAFSVQDDGAGFDSNTTPMGSGLQNMADRLAAMGGTLEILSQPARGTTITGRIPVREASVAPHENSPEPSNA